MYYCIKWDLSCILDSFFERGGGGSFLIQCVCQLICMHHAHHSNAAVFVCE